MREKQEREAKMYAETGLMFPFLPQEIQQFDDFCSSQKLNASLGNLIQTSTISDYNLGGEGDLFKAPEPVIEELMMGLDPMSAVISMISCGEDVISTQAMSVSDIESSIENGLLISEVFYECNKDLLEKEANKTPLSEVLDIKVPTLKTDEKPIADAKLLSESQFQKSVSSSCLKSMEHMHEALTRPNFLDFLGMDFGAVYGMRRAFSEGDIETLGNGNINLATQPKIISSCTSEDRKEKLSRYRSKKSKRNYGRKIKYACRKALADSQPRIRGRFAKTD